MADPKQHKQYHILENMTDDLKRKYKLVYENFIHDRADNFWAFVDEDWENVSEDDKVIYGRLLYMFHLVENPNYKITGEGFHPQAFDEDDMIFSAASYYGGYGGDDCEDYDCSSSPCGCVAPDCTSPDSTNGTHFQTQIDSSADDGHWACGSMCSDLNCYFGDHNPVALWSGLPKLSAMAVAGDPLHAWYKFRDIEIPEDARINKALVTFTSQANTILDGDVVLDITMVCDDDYEVDCFPASGETFPSDLPRLATSINWLINYDWTSDVTYPTPDLACLVQERVDSDDWTSGDDMTFLLIVDGSATEPNATRSPFDYSEDSTKAAILDIWWILFAEEEGSGGVVCDGTALDTMVINEVATGGVIVSGIGEVGDRVASGGVVCGGSAELNSIDSNNFLAFLTGTTDFSQVSGSVYTSYDLHENLNDGALADDPDYLTTGIDSYISYLHSGTPYFGEFSFEKRLFKSDDIIINARYHMLADREGANSATGSLPGVTIKIDDDVVLNWVIEIGEVSPAYNTAEVFQLNLYSLGYTTQDFIDSAIVRISNNSFYDGGARAFSFYMEFDTAVNTSGGAVASGTAEVNGGGWLELPTGGVVCDGSAVDDVNVNEVATGGVVCGGAAVLEGEVTEEEGSGGVICDGSAVDSVNVNEVATAGVVCGGVAAHWSNDFLGFQYRVKIVVPAGAVSEDLEKFYLGINTILDPDKVFYGDDFMVTDDSGVRHYHELRSYDGDTGLVHVFFKADLLADSDNVFWLYYGGVTE